MKDIREDMSTRLLVLLFLLLSVASGGCDEEPIFPAGEAPCSAQAKVIIDEVIDGDTVELTFLDGERSGFTLRARLIGIDTPEIDHVNEDHDCFALPAWQEAIDVIDGREAYVTYDAECNDDYGRLLVYLFRAEDGLFVNRHLIAEGFARACPVSPNTAFISEFESLEEEAVSQAIGRWAEPCNGGPECFQGGS
jgi:micrococcal nuclease